LPYFADYLQGGRTLGRSSLFVHTLPTSPAAEAALLFGLRGPNFYLGMPDARIAELLDTAADVLRAGAEHMLAVAADGRRAVAWLLARREAGTACAWPAWAALPLAPLPPASVFMTASGKGSGASVQAGR
jgi:3-oxoacyl-[acyl-carrier-protein] synthase II